MDKLLKRLELIMCEYEVKDKNKDYSNEYEQGLLHGTMGGLYEAIEQLKHIRDSGDMYPDEIHTTLGDWSKAL